MFLSQIWIFVNSFASDWDIQKKQPKKLQKLNQLRKEKLWREFTLQYKDNPVNFDDNLQKVLKFLNLVLTLIITPGGWGRSNPLSLYARWGWPLAGWSWTPLRLAQKLCRRYNAAQQILAGPPLPNQTTASLAKILLNFFAEWSENVRSCV